VDAGFDTIELHAGHGYLFHQFYSAVINHRNDEYGGSFENRIRFLFETVHAVRKVIHETMPLLVRISAVDYLDTPEAWTMEDSLKLSGILAENGVDFITATCGGFAHVEKSLVHPSYQLPFATVIKGQAGILTGTVRMITNAEQGNQIIVDGAADVVVVVREYLRNPHFAINTARELNLETDIPLQYKRGY
jgi:2,4-dienoyl-CoA reductase-like NADH-dependent reductase (Old Yellow Enzyme family)